jgi:hypothetical protein
VLLLKEPKEEVKEAGLLTGDALLVGEIPS